MRDEAKSSRFAVPLRGQTVTLGWLVLMLSLSGTGCAALNGSTAPAAPPHQVRIRAAAVPEGAEDLGEIRAEIRNWGYLPILVQMFISAAADKGGNFAKINDIQMQIETAGGGTEHVHFESGASIKPAFGAFSDQGADVHHMTYEHVVVTMIGHAYKVIGL